MTPDYILAKLLQLNVLWSYCLCTEKKTEGQQTTEFNSLTNYYELLLQEENLIVS